jgi:hypothetical protein
LLDTCAHSTPTIYIRSESKTSNKYELFIVTMGKKRVLCGYGIDIDAVAGWLGSYGGEDSTSDISRGIVYALNFVRQCYVLGRLIPVDHRSLCWHNWHPPSPEAS